MAVNSFFNPEIRQSLNALNGVTKDLSIQLLETLQMTQNNMNGSVLTIDDKRNLCSIDLFSPNEESIKIKIEIYNGYYDFFVKDKEVAIQQKISPIGTTLTFFQNHLRSRVEEVLTKDDNGRILRTQIIFYLEHKAINSLGTISILPYLFNHKQKEIIKYTPWISN